MICGNFSIVGNPAIKSVAMWDGTQWQPLGTGFNDSVFELAVYKGDLIAGGPFTQASGNSASLVARWNGATWEALGSGLSGPTYPAVRAFAVLGNDLVVGGTFTKSGTLSTFGIAKWNGATWSALGAGVGGGDVFALVTFQSTVVVGGNFNSAGGIASNNIAQWNGAAWSPLGTGTDSFVQALTVYDNEVIAGGNFGFAGGRPSVRVARWNGAEWNPFSSQLPPSFSAVYSLAVHKGCLFAGGTLPFVGNFTNLQQWNGTSWNALPNRTTGARISTMLSWGSDLVAIEVSTGDGGGSSSALRLWDDATWRSIGSGFDGAVHIATVFRGELVVGGRFETAPGVSARNIARWDGRSWMPLGTGTDGAVSTLVEYDGSLIAGGTFRDAGGIAVSYFARWTGDHWERIQPPGGTTSSDDFVGDLLEFNGELIGAGKFHIPGGSLVHSIARWDGTQWRPLGTGIEYANGAVSAITIFRGELVATGAFTQAGGTAANRIARWNGTQWFALDVGIASVTFSSGYALAVLNDELVVGGTFEKAGGSQAKAIAKWNGNSWSAFPAPIVSGTVNALATYGNQLIVSGLLRFQSDALAEYKIARWSGTSWQSLAASSDGPITNLCEANGELIAGGSFTQVAGNAGAYLARWSDSAVPWIVSQPDPFMTGCTKPDAHFFAQPAPGYGSLSFRWRKGGVPLADGPTGSGSAITGSASSTLIVYSANGSDEGLYDCLVGKDCGGVTTTAVRLSAPRCCPGDLDLNRHVDDSDFSLFLIGYDILDCADPSMPADCSADLNRNHFVDDADFTIFVRAYYAILCAE
ncbi:MAG: hypothetical protein JSS51_15455 [Planctomycetes bacterium]|nr:hypothetical protein [Planctomycetota bacterium]